MRAGFVLAPIGLVLIVGMIFLIRGKMIHILSSFVGYFENAVRAGFVLAPIGLVLIVGMIFLIRGNTILSLSFLTIWFHSSKLC